MTKEQAIKYKKIIKWFIDNPDKGVWYKDIKNNNNSNWHLTQEPTFNVNYIYVQNKEFAEFRKAIADGKIIQFKPIENQEQCWENISSDITPTRNFNNLDKYRIKTEKFKVGDWVIYEDNSILQIEKIETLNTKYGKELLFHTKGLKLPLKLAKLWKPKEGEWCIFWNANSYLIGKYKQHISDNDLGIAHSDFDLDEEYWKNIAPLEFVNVLRQQND